jgi:hypothetical protein
MIIFEEGILVHALVPYFLCLVILVLASIYPPRKKKVNPGNSYLYRKLNDVLLAATTFSLIVVTGNRYNAIQPVPDIQVHANVYFSSSVSSIEKPVKEKKKLNKFIKDLKKKYKGLSKSEKTIVIIAVILVAVLLIFLLGALACNLACVGSEGLAYLVFFLGLGAIVFGAVKIIRSIKRKSGEKNKGVPSS